MKTTTVAELHEHLDEYLDLVRGGEAVEIWDNEGGVGHLVPMTTTGTMTLKERLEAAVAAGKLRAPEGPLPDDFFTEALPKFSSGSVLEALLAEREEGW
jgi:antitoxin (DNA-binding transcriptional repressor) of toxin-antitoxin stability system